MKGEAKKENKTIKTITLQDGSKYIGSFEDGRIVGDAVCVRKDHVTAKITPIEQDKIKIICDDGKVFEGDCKDGKKINGKGKMIYANGDKYEGDFKEGKMEGKGIYTWKNGDKYEGDWVEGKREGKGKMKYVNGNKYEGEFKDNKISGKGKYTTIDGNIYEGDWVEGKREGKGTITYFNGCKYDGYYKDNYMEGKGILKCKNATYDGVWEKGNFREGCCIFHNDNIKCECVVEFKNFEPLQVKFINKENEKNRKVIKSTYIEGDKMNKYVIAAFAINENDDKSANKQIIQASSNYGDMENVIYFYQDIKKNENNAIINEHHDDCFEEEGPALLIFDMKSFLSAKDLDDLNSDIEDVKEYNSVTSENNYINNIKNDQNNKAFYNTNNSFLDNSFSINNSINYDNYNNNDSINSSFFNNNKNNSFFNSINNSIYNNNIPNNYYKMNNNIFNKNISYNNNFRNNNNFNNNMNNNNGVFFNNNNNNFNTSFNNNNNNIYSNKFDMNAIKRIKNINYYLNQSGKNCARVLYNDGNVYDGEWANNKRSGKGTFYCKTQYYTYSGDWVEDKKQGEGTILYNDGKKYVGMFYNDYSKEGTLFDKEGNAIYKNSRNNNKSATYQQYNNNNFNYYKK